MDNYKELDEITTNKLLEELFLQTELEEECKVLKKYGIDVDIRALTEFHNKKEEIFSFVKQHAQELSKLEPKDLENISGGRVNDGDNLSRLLIYMGFEAIIKLPLNFAADIMGLGFAAYTGSPKAGTVLAIILKFVNEIIARSYTFNPPPPYSLRTVK